MRLRDVTQGSHLARAVGKKSRKTPKYLSSRGTGGSLCCRPSVIAVAVPSVVDAFFTSSSHEVTVAY